MPKLVYFGMQGRAQAIRYALAAQGAEYEGVDVGFEEWGKLKADGTYGVGNSLPVWVTDDGKMLNQSIAILRMVCSMGGFVAKSPEEEYDCQWFFDADADWMKADGSMKPIFNADADEAAIDKCVEIMAGHLGKIDEKLADGRKYSAGENVTAFDFRLLTISTGICNNETLKVPALGEKLRALWAKHENIVRVEANLKELPNMADAIKAAADRKGFI